MSIKLKGSTAGSVAALDAPANTSPSGSDIALTLPIDAGSANQVLKNGSTAGQLEFGQPTPQPGQIIEQFEGICDGRQITVGSGTYTLGTVTHGQAPGTTYEDLTGSNIAYTPPSGTKTVVYDFRYFVSFTSTNPPFAHQKLFVDSSEVTIGRSAGYAHYDGFTHMRIPFTLDNATEDIANGKIGTWTSSKTLKYKLGHMTQIMHLRSIKHITGMVLLAGKMLLLL